MSETFSFTQIGVVHSCYQQKFGIPRQPGLISAATARIELIPPFNRLDVLDGLEGFSHLWVHFIFHQCIQDNWKAKIRPPRLGGKKKVGVFASRATHRPNPIGLSVVKIGNIYQEGNRVFIDIIGADLLDQTPVVDLKPYLPYADAITDAQGGFAPLPVVAKPVRFSDSALVACDTYLKQTGRNIQLLATQIIEQDPRPSYLWGTTGREHGNQIWDANIKWVAYDEYFEVQAVEFVEVSQDEQKTDA